MLVAIVNSDRQSAGQFTPKDPYFDTLEWIGESRIGVMMCGRANRIYWVVDAKSGATLHKHSVASIFSGRTIVGMSLRGGLGAITREDEKGASFESDELSYLMVNDDSKEIYSPEDWETIRTDSWLLDVVSPTR